MAGPSGGLSDRLDAIKLYEKEKKDRQSMIIHSVNGPPSVHMCSTDEGSDTVVFLGKT